MQITLPVAINGKFGKIAGAVVKRPTSGVLADTKRVFDSGDVYKALQTYVAGCLESLGDMTDKASIKAAAAGMPYRSAEYAAARVSLLGREDDGLEGVYQCPRCGAPKVCEKTADADTRDFFGSLPVVPAEGDFFSVAFDPPIQVHDVADEPNQTVSSASFAWPTLAHCSTALGRVGDKDSMRFAFATFVEAMVAVNGVELQDAKWKGRFGMMMFNSMDADDLRKINEKDRSVGVQSVVGKDCAKCSKRFDAVVSPLDFFASSLR